MIQLGLVIGWILTVFLGVLGAIILWLILVGRIDLKNLISESSGEASLARFQFLVFTFVIALSLFYLVVTSTPPGYPIIPSQILGLLGISGGSYVVAKGIQTSRDIGITEAKMGTGSGTAAGASTTETTTTTTTIPPTPSTPPTPPTPPESPV
jgi:hypothetical protein